jgi:hypothetical protein
MKTLAENLEHAPGTCTRGDITGFVLVHFDSLDFSKGADHASQ